MTDCRKCPKHEMRGKKVFCKDLGHAVDPDDYCVVGECIMKYGIGPV